MLPKINRIKKDKDFKMAFKNGLSFKNSNFILKTVKNNLKESRFGFVVSQKVSKKAVIRNKIRRRISESIRAKLREIKTGLDLVFVCLPSAENKSFSEIKESLYNLLKKAGAI